MEIVEGFRECFWKMTIKFKHIYLSTVLQNHKPFVCLCRRRTKHQLVKHVTKKYRLGTKLSGECVSSFRFDWKKIEKLTEWKSKSCCSTRKKWPNQWRIDGLVLYLIFLESSVFSLFFIHFILRVCPFNALHKLILLSKEKYLF